MLVDSHCHLNLLDLNDQNNLDSIINRAREKDVGYILNVCVALSEFENVLKTAEQFPNVGASIGLHPNERKEEVDLPSLVKLGQHAKVIAVGETGLDYYRSSGDLEWQKERFRCHIEAAKILKKPLIVHARQAREDIIHILQREHAYEVGGVMHCFTEDLEIAQQALDINFYISFSGIVTFKNAARIQAVAKQIPLNKILIETDAPYLAPEPHRGKPNEPAFVSHTAAYLAELRDVSLSEFADKTTTNFFTLFKMA